MGWDGKAEGRSMQSLSNFPFFQIVVLIMRNCESSIVVVDLVCSNYVVFITVGHVLEGKMES